jgi:hypothetical protein
MIEMSATGESVMNKWQWRGIVSVLFALSLVLVWSAGTAVAQATEICDNGKDDDGDGLIDGADPDCKKPPPGIPCSPGFWKTEQHRGDFNAACGDAAALATSLGLTALDTCAELLAAVGCKGADATCLRSLAASLLNTVSSCEE